MRRIIAAIIMIVALAFGYSNVASAHDITQPSGVCKSPNSADFSFTFTNFGSEQRYIKIFQDGTLISNSQGLAGDGVHIISVTGIDTGNQDNVQFTFQTDAVNNGTSDILVDFTSCVPEETTVVTNPPCSEDCGTTTTTSTTSTTVFNCGLCAGQFGTTTTTVPGTTTTTTVAQTSSTSTPPSSVERDVVPPEPEPTITTTVPSLPVTGSNDALLFVAAIVAISAGGALVLLSIRRDA